MTVTAPIDLTNLVDRMRSNTRNHVEVFAPTKTTSHSLSSLATRVDAAVERLRAAGIEAGHRVALRAPNSIDWIVHDLALLQLRAVSLAFTDDFADKCADELIEAYGLSMLLVTAKERDALDPPNPAVMAVDAPPKGPVRVCAQPAIDDADYTHHASAFSSGSAGGVKGLIMNRRGVERTIDAFCAMVGPRRDDRLLLFLPMSNYQQRMMYYAAFWFGFDVQLCTPTRVFAALQRLSPTLVIAPPVFYEAFENQFLNLAPWQRGLAALCADGIGRLPSPTLRRALGARLFRTAHQALGGHMRFMITGMAPIRRSTLRLFQRMQLPLFETYGLNESGAVSLNTPAAHRPGSVGRPLPGVTISFTDEQEIIVHRQPLPSSGYFQAASGEYERTYLGDGRVATGDIGRIDEDGYLHIVGRIKEVIVTSGGEKVHPEVLEAAIGECEQVERAVVLADPDGDLVAVVIPRGENEGHAEQIIQRHIDGVGHANGRVFISRVLYTTEKPSRDNGMLRPNLKLDRRAIARRFGVLPRTET